MHKLKLDVERLEVESFTTDAVEGLGTVHAHTESNETVDMCCGLGQEVTYTCTEGDKHTCRAGCQETQAPQRTCYQSCGGGCDTNPMMTCPPTGCGDSCQCPTGFSCVSCPSPYTSPWCCV